MGYRILADEHVEPSTRGYLRQLGHDVEWVGDVPELGLGASDDEILVYSRRDDRLILTQDDDFLTDLDPSAGGNVLLPWDQSLSSREVGDVVDTMARYVPQSEVVLEYVSKRWL